MVIVYAVPIFIDDGIVAVSFVPGEGHACMLTDPERERDPL